MREKSIAQYIFYVSILVILGMGCKSSPESVETAEDIDQIVIRMQSEPSSFSPILARSSSSREIYQYLFMNLADYDYQTLELTPILIEAIPEGVVKDESVVAYEMRIRDEATWPDGSPVTGEDILFTYKIAAHPAVSSPGWKQLASQVADIVVDTDDPKSFVVQMNDSYFLNKEAMLSAEVYPKYLFDPSGVLDERSLSDIMDEDAVKAFEQDSAFQRVAATFSSIDFSKKLPTGSGPYEIEKWEPSQFVVLKKKDNYWGASLDVDQLKSYPERIVFQFLKDETSALTLLKSGDLDLINMTRFSVAQYEELKRDTSLRDDLTFQQVEIPRSYILNMNNDDTRLGQLSVRKAIAHLTDVDRMINQVDGGYGTRVNSFIHHLKPEYNDRLPSIDFDIEKAKEILDDDGWVDSDGDGTRDKLVNGKKESLSFRFHITGSLLSSSISAIMSENCRQAGIDIDIIEKPWPATRVENINTGDYDLFVGARTQSIVRDDPQPSWHSSSIGAGGANMQRYASSDADQLIDQILHTMDEDVRIKAYDDLQQVIAMDYPVVFLYSPKIRLVHDKNVDLVTSAKRPGFFLNARGD